MRLPGGDRVLIDRGKLVGYVLSAHHPVGKHKARVFASTFGLTDASADLLAEAPAEAAAQDEAIEMAADVYGRRFQIRFLFRFGARSAMITSGWIVPTDGSRTRLTSADVK